MVSPPAIETLTKTKGFRSLPFWKVGSQYVALADLEFKYFKFVPVLCVYAPVAVREHLVGELILTFHSSCPQLQWPDSMAGTISG